jgi:uncharacterized protein CbrC (UPF0167 family)
MPRKPQSKGTCNYCHKEMAKGGISKHLATCPVRQAAIAKAESNKKSAPEQLYHLRVQDAYSTDFWLDLEMRGSKSLNDLDSYLREIWLECCGHLSEFSLGGFGNTIGKQRKINDVFQRTDALEHTYDFGTSSETLVKVVNVREGNPTTPKPIALMARNVMPTVKCVRCEQQATHVCMECVYEDETDGTLCDKHTENHPHDNYGEPMELFNSPRSGMCGYCGPAVPPY